MINLSNVEKGYADKKLFDKLNLTIYDGERVGIVGNNGAGKSTLLRIIAGEEEPDAGSVFVDSTIGYLKQITEYSYQDFIDLVESPEFIKDFLRIKSLLKIKNDIEFTPERLKSLSGGERTKLMLASVMCKNPEVLILDEPTNHLDIAGVDWLIDALNGYYGTTIIVSHDRYFLNKTIDKIVEIENGKVDEFYGAYDKYYAEKQKDLELRKAQYESQKAEERKINKQIEKLNNWSNKAESNARRQGGMMSDSRIKGAETKAQVSAVKLAKQAKAKISKLEHEKEGFIDRPYEEGEVYYRLDPSEFRGKVLVRFDDVSKSFGNNVLFENVSFAVEAGEKIAILGQNGSGKSTLLKMILGEEKYQGNIWISPAVKASYLSQDVLDLDENMTVMEKASEGGHEYKTLFLSNLRNMNMSRQVFDRKIGTLSLGERMRIKMCEIVLSDYNLLILDEPTNHLDINNKIFMEKVLQNYNGALLLVSHDKELVKNVATSTLEIEGKTIKKKQIDKEKDCYECEY